MQLYACTVKCHYFIVIHTFAALRGKENYDVIKNGFAPVLKEINELIENGTIAVADLGGGQGWLGLP